jgi:hypothetical protein
MAANDLTSPSPQFLRSVIFKALGLFVVFNLLFAGVNPVPALGRLSLYNHLFPGRPIT